MLINNWHEILLYRTREYLFKLQNNSHVDYFKIPLVLELQRRLKNLSDVQVARKLMADYVA